MKSSVNVVVIAGNLVAAPELKNSGGTDFVHFRIACIRRWQNGAGENRQRVEIVAESLELLRKPRVARATESE